MIANSIYNRPRLSFTNPLKKKKCKLQSNYFNIHYCFFLSFCLNYDNVLLDQFPFYVGLHYYFFFQYCDDINSVLRLVEWKTSKYHFHTKLLNQCSVEWIINKISIGINNWVNLLVWVYRFVKSHSKFVIVLLALLMNWLVVIS